MDQKEQLHSIQQVSTKLNIPKPTLRFWEKEFEGFLKPLRTNGGQRRYSNKHLEVIEKIKKMKARGLSLPEIRNQLEYKFETITNRKNMRTLDDLAQKVAEAVKREIYNHFYES